MKSNHQLPKFNPAESRLFIFLIKNECPRGLGRFTSRRRVILNVGESIPIINSLLNFKPSVV